MKVYDTENVLGFREEKLKNSVRLLAKFFVLIIINMTPFIV
jgi:hypothetical protein